MTAYGFFETYFTIPVSLFYPALDNSVFIPESIYAHFTANGWGYPAKFSIILIAAMLFYTANAFGSEIGFYGFVNLIQQIQFVFFKWCTCIAIFTTSALTFHKVAHK